MSRDLRANRHESRGGKFVSHLYSALTASSGAQASRPSACRGQVPEKAIVCFCSTGLSNDQWLVWFFPVRAVGFGFLGDDVSPIGYKGMDNRVLWVYLAADIFRIVSLL